MILQFKVKNFLSIREEHTLEKEPFHYPVQNYHT